MDLYKFITFVFIVGVLTLMGTTLEEPDNTWSNYIDHVEADNANTRTQEGLQDLQDSDSIYTPQNENTQNEGTGGVGISKLTQNVYGIFKLFTEGIQESQTRAEQGQNETGVTGMIWWAIGLFWVAIGFFITIKIVNFIKNKDTT